MGGDGYALLRAESDTPLAQLRSRENRARSDLPRRSPSDMFEESGQYVKDCMKEALVGQSLELDAPSRNAICTGRMRQMRRYFCSVWAC
jgi:hypothetical protein